MLVWGLHVTLLVIALGASWSRVSQPRLDRIAVGVVGGHLAVSNLYLYLLPDRPWLVANGITCLLMLAAVFFLWSTRRVLALAAVAVTGFVLVVMLGPGPDADVPAGTVPIAIGMLGIGIGIVVESVRVLERLRRSLAQREVELGALSTRLMSVQEEERRRLSRELHDEVGQSLAAVNSYLWLIERHPHDADTLRTRTAEARRLVARTLGALRELSQLLRPSTLDTLGLVASLDTALETFTNQHQIRTTFAAEDLPDRLPAEVETALYRITQEALTNVARHAQASQVTVRLSVAGPVLRLDIQDDGRGFGQHSDRNGGGGTGLVSIRERVRALHGTLTLHPGKGARLTVDLPFARAAVAAASSVPAA